MDDTGLTSGLRQALNDQREEMKKRNQLPNGGYISDRFVKELFTREKLRRQLQLDLPKAPLQDFSELVVFIERRARKIFAILVLINKGGRIVSLQNSQPILDDHALFDISHDDASNSRFVLERLLGIPELRDVAQEVYEMHWVFPTVLSPAVHFEFDPKFFKFPFKNKPERIGSGGFGQVRKVIFEKGYLKDLDGHDENDMVAYKKILPNTQNADDVERVMKEVRFLRSRKHPNLSSLIASFTAGLEMPTIGGQETKCLFLVSPLAEMDMQIWLDQKPDDMELYETWRSQEFKAEVQDSMRGLISGLAYIHRKIGYEAGYHGDIKPKNILRFGSQRMLAWKICDFGTSNLKPVDDTATRNVATDPYWAPKEFVTDTSEDTNHGRSHDVWSMGCIFVLLATMLVHGRSSEGLEAFEKLRARGGKEKMEHAFSKCPDQIKQWIAKLKGQNDKLRDLLDLIQDMLQPREARIFSWEVAVDISIFTNPLISREEIVKHLEDVIQVARPADLELKHNPMTRARKDSKKGHSYEQVLLKNGWYDDLTSKAEMSLHAAKRSVSTLPTLEHGVLTSDMKAVIDTISKRFEEKSSVALVGLRGVGKSLAALHYATGSEGLRPPPAKDVFWVRANDLKDFDDSYEAIAAGFKIEDPGFGSKEKLRQFVKSHLEKSQRDWFMVVDGFDHDRETNVIRHSLPSRNGKILYTTKNLLQVKDLVDWKKRRGCIEMQCPGSASAMALFSTYVDDSVIDTGGTHATRLSEEFNWPEMIQRISRYMNDTQNNYRQMYKLLQERKYEQTEYLLPNFAEQLLIPTLGHSLRNENEWSDELSLLVLLCLFDDKTGLDLKLIRVEYSMQQRGQLNEWLEKLLACCFIRKQDTDRAHPVYLVDTTVNLAVRAWMVKNDTPRSKLQRYNKVLSMLFRSYDSRKKVELNKRNKTPSRGQKSFASFKAALMPHFNRFVKFAGDNAEQISFSLYDRAVQAVVLFSDVLVHRGQFEDAIKVLEFTKRHFGLEERSRTEEEDTKEKGSNKNKAEDEMEREIEKAKGKTRRRRRNAYFQLVDLLAKAYLSRPKDRKSPDYLERARKLIENSQRETASSDDTVIWKGRTLRAWDLQRQMVRVLWKSGEFDKARAVFGKLPEIAVKLEGNEAVLQHHEDAVYESNDKQEMQKLAIQVKREESLLAFAHGEKLKSNGKKTMAMKQWNAAYYACVDSQKALQQWFSTDDTMMFEINEDKAKILVRIGNTEDLNDAADFFQRALEIFSQEGEHAYKQRTWDFKCRLDEIRLKRRGPGDLDMAKESLNQLRSEIQAALGDKHDLTLHCAALSVEACNATGKRQEARELERAFGNLPRSERRSQWTRWLEKVIRAYWGYCFTVMCCVIVAWILRV